MKSKLSLLFCVGVCTLLLTLQTASAAEKLKLLLIDGQNNHKWQQTTPLLVKIFADSGRFTVDVATSPPKGQDLSEFRPEFKKYDVIVSNYNGDLWCKAAQQDFIDYVKDGGGVVIVHAANNAFSNWPEYNEVIGLGGWGGRNEQAGPYVRLRDGKFVKDLTPGRGGSHGPRHEFPVVVRQPNHPILKGLPREWLHTEDELYDRLRGPANSLNVLATAYSDPEKRGTGEHEPMLMTVGYGKGRVFHTTLGHDQRAMECVGFIVTTARGAEWAATGEVTQTDVPADFPTPEKSTSRSLAANGHRAPRVRLRTQSTARTFIDQTSFEQGRF